MEPVNIRAIRKEELALLEGLLYQAIFQPDSAPRLPREVIYQPEVRVYIDHFGEQQEDYCLVAESQGEVVGAVWIRVLAGAIKGYGNIDDRTPEFAIAVFDDYQKQGIGTRLMERMIEWMRQEGYAKASLSVNKENYAAKMYRKLGFEIVEEREEDYLMLLTL